MTRKLEYFAAAIEREAAARVRRAKHQLANDLSAAAAAEIAAAEEAARARVQKARRDLQREANKKIAAATAEAKAAYYAAQNAAQAELLDGVRQDLKNFTQSDEYKSYLKERVAEAKAAVKFEAKVLISPEGGFILQSKNGKIRADYTFKTRLEEAGEVMGFANSSG